MEGQLNNSFEWLVRFTGHSELEAVTKANCFWVKEQDKQKALDRSCPQKSDSNGLRPISEGRGAHFAGKIWMVNKSTGHKVRISANEQAQYEQNGYQRGGPRS